MMPWPPRPDDEAIDWGDEPVEPPPPPSVGRSLRLAFSAVYDYMAATITASVLSFVVFFMVFSLLYSGMVRMVDPRERALGMSMVLILLFVSPLVLGPLTAGLFTIARNMFRRDDPHLLDVWRGAVRLVLPSIGLAAVQVLVTTVLVADVLWLLTRDSTPMKVFGIGIGYIFLFWAMMATYHWPLLVEQRPPLRTVLYRGFLLAGHNPLYTLAITLLFVVLLAGPVLLVFGPAAGPAVLFPVSMFWGVLLPAIQISATLEILRRYEENVSDGGNEAG